MSRESRASTPAIFFALSAVAVALIGNIFLNPSYVWVFAAYFLAVGFTVMLMFLRTTILTTVLRFAEHALKLTPHVGTKLQDIMRAHLHEVSCRRIIFFAHSGTSDELRRVAHYVRKNEQIRHLTIVWCYPPGSLPPEDLASNLKLVDIEHPEVRMDLLLVEGSLDARLASSLSKTLDVPTNYMFVTSESVPNADLLASFGGVRMIF